MAELQEIIQGNVQVTKFKLPDPIKNMSEFSGNKKELSAWLEELDELYEMYVLKGDEGAPDTIPGHYRRAIKNKFTGDARKRETKHDTWNQEGSHRKLRRSERSRHKPITLVSHEPGGFFKKGSGIPRTFGYH